MPAPRRRELIGWPQRRTNMAVRFVALLVALTATTAACGSDGTAPGDTLPAPTTAITLTTVSEAPSTVSPIPVTQPENLPDPTMQAELDAARELWAAQGPGSYTIVTQSLCFCPAEQWSDTIVEGVVTEHAPVTDALFSDPAARPMGLLFDEVQRAIDNGYASLTVSYDPDTGAVEQFFVDVDEMMADEEYGVQVVSLEPLN